MHAPPQQASDFAQHMEVPAFGVSCHNLNYHFPASVCADQYRIDELCESCLREEMFMPCNWSLTDLV